MERPSRTSAVMVAVIVVLLLPVLSGVAAGALPVLVHPYLWLVWPISVLLAIPVMVREVRRNRSRQEQEPSAPQGDQIRQRAAADQGASVYQAGRDLVLLGQLAQRPEQAPHPLAPPRSAETWMRHADVDHERMFGIDRILEKLGRLVANDGGDWIISIFGDGGAGKTTLAYELVKRHAAVAGFERVAWVSAKFSHLRALGRVERSRHTAISWHDLLLDVTRQLGLDIELNPVRVEGRLAEALRALGPDDRCLIVIDNLETLADAERAVDYLVRSSVLRPHKVIITTRKSTEKLSALVREVPWHGLAAPAAREFARYLAADEPDFKLATSDLDQVVTTSAGIPLLVKMIVRLAVVEARPIAEVVGQLNDPKGELGGRVGHYLYEQAMDALATKVGEAAATGLMNVFCCRAPGESFTRDEFYELSLIDDREVFERARIVARDLALVRALDGNSRFTVHPLLREFVCSAGDQEPHD
jgi:NB-ARC domain